MRDPATCGIMTARHATAVLAGITLLVLMLSLPGSLRDAFDRGGIYLFSRAFLEDIPQRLTGPGRFRFAARYDRDGSDLGLRGLYLDLPPWGYHVFAANIV